MKNIVKLYKDNKDLILVFPDADEKTVETINKIITELTGCSTEGKEIENLSPTEVETAPEIPKDEVPNFVKENEVEKDKDLENPGVHKYTRGKHKGEKISDVFVKDAGYVCIKFTPTEDKPYVEKFLETINK